MSAQFTFPFSPKGKSAIVPSPPWSYAGDALVIEFWAEPGAVKALLPEGLKLDEDAGHAQALFVDWQFTAANEELLDPARYQYREFYILLDAVYRDKKRSPFARTFSSTTIRRWLAVGRRVSQAARIRLSNENVCGAEQSVAECCIRQPFRWVDVANGQRLAEGRVLIEKPLDDPSSMASRPTVNLRHFPQLAAGKHQHRPCTSWCKPSSATIRWRMPGSVAVSWCFLYAQGKNYLILRHQMRPRLPRVDGADGG